MCSFFSSFVQFGLIRSNACSVCCVCIYFEYVIVMADFESCFASFLVLAFFRSYFFSFLFFVVIVVDLVVCLFVGFDHEKSTKSHIYLRFVCVSVCVELSFLDSLLLHALLDIKFIGIGHA